jgi:hypothetical protein
MRAATIVLASVVILSQLFLAAPVRADGEATGGQQLRQELESGLKARQPQEFTFIAHVVELVDSGNLPLDIVKGTFHWSRKRNPRIPFPYFEQALRLRAGELGVSLD